MTASVYSTACGGLRGGDIYYLSVCGADMLTRVAMADLRGHGESVSQLSQFVYDALLDSMSTLDSTCVLSTLNQQVRSRGFDAITTAAVVSYYRGNSNLYFSNAGHPPVFLKRHDERTWSPLTVRDGDGPSNLPLGVLSQTRYEQEQVELAPGDRVFLYTDGVTECPNAQGEFFGEERLCEALNAADGCELLDVKRTVLDGLRQFGGGNLTHDDITFLVAEVSPARRP